MKIPSERFIQIYGEAEISKKRFERVEEAFYREFGESECEFFSAPGRTEIVGNHTDHNGGKVIAASISQDSIAAAFSNRSNKIEIISEGYSERIVVDLNSFSSARGSAGTKALVAGMVEAVLDFGYQISGFSAYVTSDVIAASGVSSSASFEMLICSIINFFFNEGKMSFVDYAKIGQYAENRYWNKASGLMDQLACAVGGMIRLDFSDDVRYEKIPFDLNKFQYGFILVNSETNHASLSAEYSAVPREMLCVAENLGANKLSQSSLDALLSDFPKRRKEISCDRAILRAFHFYKENERVNRMAQALIAGDNKEILAILQESGASSWKYLQNCYVAGNTADQNVALNLALSEIWNEEHAGVCRVHGGGFSGVILEVVPKKAEKEYIAFMADRVGEKNIYPIAIRQVGAIHV